METIEVVLLGNRGVGKSCFMRQLLTNEYDEKYIPTYNFDRHSVYNYYYDKKYNVIDMAGDELSIFNMSTYFENADMFIIFYESTNFTSFQDILDWESKIRNPMAKIKYVRTKCDLQRQISHSKYNEVRISSKLNINLNEVFK